MNKVLVLLSTYNGEKYLTEQIMSVLNQTIPVELLIRDDGSTDKTIDILNGLSLDNSNISIIRGENIGFINSYNFLISQPLLDQYKLVAFCDQDDVWSNDKLELSIKAISQKYNPNIPVLYCSNLDVVNESLEYIRKARKGREFTQKSALVQNIASGCTEVFNNAAVRLYRKGIGSRMEAHDYWMYLICIMMGCVIYDPISHIKYRQHQNNAIGIKGVNLFSFLKHICFGESGKRSDMLTDFLNVYQSDLSDDTMNRIKTIILSKKSIINRLKLFFDWGYRGDSLRITAGFKTRALIGKIY